MTAAGLDGRGFLKTHLVHRFQNLGDRPNSVKRRFSMPQTDHAPGQNRELNLNVRPVLP